MDESCACASLPNVIDRKQVKDIPQLERAEQVAVDAKLWTATYQCPVCGQQWLEEWTEYRYLEIPSVRRISQ